MRGWSLLLMGMLLQCVACLSLAATSATNVTLRSMENWVVVVASDAIPSEHYAASEFCRLFKTITGCELMVRSSTDGKNAVYIGESPAQQQHPLGFGVSNLGEEGLRIRIGTDAVAIAGGRPRGTLYGIYEFFERYLGVRFLTRDHTYIPPRAADTVIPLADYQYIPAFSFRWPYYLENRADPAFAARLRVNTVSMDEVLGGKTAQELINHSMDLYLPTSVYGADHPEYFALVRGIRRLRDSSGEPPQVCSLNPEVIRIVCEGVERALEANPALKNISVSPMDNDEFCECPRCSALAIQEESSVAPHLTLVNAVAERIAKSHPDVRVGTLAYWYTRKPPKTIQLQPNVEIMLCSIEACILHPFNDPNCIRNKEFVRDLQGWRKICRNISVWTYNTNFSNYDLPFPNLNVLAKNVQFLADSNVRGVFMQAAGNGLTAELSDLRNYVIAQCLWHPTQESWALVEEFCRLHYGAAATPILAYLRFLHQNAERRGLHPGCFSTAIELGLDPDVARQIGGYFEAALEIAPDATIRARIEKARIPALRTLLATAPLVHENGLYRLDTVSAGMETLDRYIALVHEFGMDKISGPVPVGSYIDELRDLEKGLPTAVIENDTWRVALLPEQDGRIVEMTYKPTARNLVNVPATGFTRWELEEQWPQAVTAGQVKTPVRTWTVSKNSILMTKRLPDGSTWHRTVSLPVEATGLIRVQVEFIAAGSHPGWEIREIPGFFLVSNSPNPDTVGIYTKNSGWTQINRGWDFKREFLFERRFHPQANLSAFAYYDYSESYGLAQVFTAGSFARLQTFWNPERKAVALKMFTPATPIAPDQKLTFTYDLSYLDKPPTGSILLPRPQD